MKLVNNLDFQGFEARNIRLQNLATAPASPVIGQTYFDTVLGKPRIWDGSAWDDLGKGNIEALTVTAPITSTGGTSPQIGISAATTGAAGSMSAADKTKLDGVATGATANSTDATLLNRANHTGSQAISTVTGLQTALDGKASTSHTHTLNDLSDVTASGAPAANSFLGWAGSDWRDIVVDKTLVGLGNVDNTSDAAKPVSTATQSALNTKINNTEKAAANGVATLGADGKVPTAQLPNLSLTDVSVVATIAARDGLTVDEGDVAIVTGTSQTFVYDGTAWQAIVSPTDGVQSVTAGTGITVGGTATSPSVSLSSNGVTATQLDPTVAGNGLTGGGGTALAVNVGTGLEISADAVRIAAAAAGNGLTGGAGSALAVGAGTGISVAADAVAVDTAVVVRKYATNIGDAVATSFTITHNLGTRDVTTAVYLNSGTYEAVLADVEHTTTNTVTVRFATAPAASAYRVVVHG